jgi:hypothetical protein
LVREFKLRNVKMQRELLVRPRKLVSKRFVVRQKLALPKRPRLARLPKLQLEHKPLRPLDSRLSKELSRLG